MKKLLLTFVSLCFFVFAIDGVEKEHIRVVGEAKIMVIPDKVTITFGVRSADKNLKDAKDNNDEIIRKAIKTITKYGVSQKHIRTTGLSVHPNYNGRWPEYTIDYYTVNNSLEVTLTNISTLDEIMLEVIEDGVNTVNNITFSSSKIKEYEKDAQIAAAKDAKEKANEIASVLGVKAGKPISVDVTESFSPLPVYNRPMARGEMLYASTAKDEIGESISAGEIAVVARVMVVFELE